jgi:di/tricarboxylate transporter
MSLVAMCRNEQPIREHLQDVRIEVGDVVVLEVDEAFFFVNSEATEFSLVRRLRGYTIQRWHKAATATVITAAIGVAAAVSESGLAADIATLLTRLGGGNPVAALAVVFIGRIVMANLITNTASAVFMFPIALSIADQLGVNFMPFAIALMTGTIGAAITPAAYQTNLMVYGPGEYSFADFVKMGIPLTVLVGVITVWLAPVSSVLNPLANARPSSLTSGNCGV